MIAFKNMIDGVDKEIMHKATGASSGCPSTNVSHLSCQDSGNSVENFPGTKADRSGNGFGVCPTNFLYSDQSYSEGSRAMHQGNHMPLYQQDFFVWPFVCNDVQMVQHNNFFNNNFYPMNRGCFYTTDNKIQYAPCTMVSQSYPPEVQFQEFQYFVVIDFEATCDKDKNPHPQEIIEFPSVLVNSLSGQLEASFQTYVRPAYHQCLTDFCKELTGIQQIQVDRGVSLSEALLMHDKWLEDKGIKHMNFAVVTWSNWDCRVMLESECRLKGIRKPSYFNKWINLKVPFHEVYGGVRCNLKEAVQLAGLAWEGRAHCGLDDARNTARLLSLLMHRGFRFSITNSLTWHCMEHPLNHPNGQMDPAAQNLNPNETMMSRQALQFQHCVDHTREMTRYCFCGAKSTKCLVRKPGPMQGRWFFGCGNWTASGHSACDYFVWASPP